MKISQPESPELSGERKSSETRCYRHSGAGRAHAAIRTDTKESSAQKHTTPNRAVLWCTEKHNAVQSIA